MIFAQQEFMATEWFKLNLSRLVGDHATGECRDSALHLPVSGSRSGNMMAYIIIIAPFPDHCLLLLLVVRSVARLNARYIYISKI